jgi:hypothetical protein
MPTRRSGWRQGTTLGDVVPWSGRARPPDAPLHSRARLRIARQTATARQPGRNRSRCGQRRRGDKVDPRVELNVAEGVFSRPDLLNADGRNGFSNSWPKPSAETTYSKHRSRLEHRLRNPYQRTSRTRLVRIVSDLGRPQASPGLKSPRGGNGATSSSDGCKDSRIPVITRILVEPPVRIELTTFSLRVIFSASKRSLPLRRSQ